MKNTLGICTTLSECHTIISTGIDRHAAEQPRVHPIPAHDQLIVEGLVGSGWIELVDAQGRVVLSVRVDGTTMALPLAGMAPGIYTVRTRQGERTRAMRLVVR